MRKLLVALLLISVPVMLISADRAPGSYSIGAFGGLGMPMGPKDFKDSFKKAIGFGGEFKYNMNETTSLAVSFSYVPLKLDVDKLTGDLGTMKAAAADLKITGGNLNVSPISVNLIKYFSPPEASAGIYATLGGAYYMMKFTDMKISSTYSFGGQTQTFEETAKGESENDFGLNGGLGVEFKAGETVNIFVEGKYHYIFTKNDATDGESNKAGDKMQYLSVFGGIRLGLSR